MTLIKEKDIKAIEEELKAKQTELADLETSKDSEVTERESALAFVEKNSSDLILKKEEKKAREDEKIAKEKEIKEKEDAIAVLQSEEEKIQEDLSESESAAGEKEQEIKDYKEQDEKDIDEAVLQAKEGELDAIKKTIEGFEEALDGKKAELAENKKDKKEVDDEAKSIDDDLKVDEEIIGEAEKNISEASNAVKELDLKIRARNEVIEEVGKAIIALESDPTAVAFEKQKVERQDLVDKAFNSPFVKEVLLADEIGPELKEAGDRLKEDVEFLQDEFKNAMGIENDDIIKKTIEEVRDTGGIITAGEALELSRKSIFELNSISEKIKEACAKGFTSLEVSNKEVSGLQVYALMELGYKVTHEFDEYFEEVRYIIHWTYASGENK